MAELDKPDLQSRHLGYHSDRLHGEHPREDAFAFAWQTENAKEPGPLEQLFPKPISPQTAKSAATVIQWLGTPTGMAFLRGVVRNSPDVAEGLSPSLKAAKIALEAREQALNDPKRKRPLSGGEVPGSGSGWLWGLGILVLLMIEAAAIYVIFFR